MRNSHIFIQNFFHRLELLAHARSRDFWSLEIFLWLHMFATSIVTIFIPILMLQSGFSLSQVLLFYIIYHGVNVPLNNLGRWIVRTCGAKWTIVMATIVNILFFMVYSQISEWGHVVLLALLFALYDALYYVAALYIFIGSTKDPENTGENTGILHFVVRSAALLGPILGSIIVLSSDGSKLALVSTAIVFFALSLIPLFSIKEIATKPEHAPIGYKEFFKSPREIKNHLSVGLFKIHEGAENIIWPIFIFLAFDELGSVALLGILVPIVSLLFSYTAGHIRRGQREKIIMFGALALALVWVGRMVFDHEVFLYGSVVATGLFGLFIIVPLDANIFLRGSHIGALSASMYRNQVSMFSKFLLFSVLFLAVDVFHVSFSIAVGVLIALAIVNYWYLQWRKNKPGMQTSIPGMPRH